MARYSLERFPEHLRCRALRRLETQLALVRRVERRNHRRRNNQRRLSGDRIPAWAGFEVVTVLFLARDVRTLAETVDRPG